MRDFIVFIRACLLTRCDELFLDLMEMDAEGCMSRSERYWGAVIWQFKERWLIWRTA